MKEISIAIIAIATWEFLRWTWEAVLDRPRERARPAIFEVNGRKFPDGFSALRHADNEEREGRPVQVKYLGREVVE